MSQDGARLPEAEVDESFRDRPAYQEGYPYCSCAVRCEMGMTAANGTPNKARCRSREASSPTGSERTGPAARSSWSCT